MAFVLCTLFDEMCLDLEVVDKIENKFACRSTFARWWLRTTHRFVLLSSAFLWWCVACPCSILAGLGHLCDDTREQNEETSVATILLQGALRYRDLRAYVLQEVQRMTHARAMYGLNSV